MLVNILCSEKYCARKKTALFNCAFEYTALGKILCLHTGLSKKIRRSVRYCAWKNTALGTPRFPTALRNGPCQLCLYTALGKLRSVIYWTRKSTAVGKNPRLETVLSNILRSVKYCAFTLT